MFCTTATRHLLTASVAMRIVQNGKQVEIRNYAQGARTVCSTVIVLAGNDRARESAMQQLEEYCVEHNVPMNWPTITVYDMAAKMCMVQMFVPCDTQIPITACVGPSTMPACMVAAVRMKQRNSQAARTVSAETKQTLSNKYTMQKWQAMADYGNYAELWMLVEPSNGRTAADVRAEL